MIDPYSEDFVYSAPLIQEGFNSVMHNFEACSELKVKYLTDFTAAFKSGDPKKEKQAVLLNFKDTNWKWIEFEQWNAEFKKSQVWPKSWRFVFYSDDDDIEQIDYDKVLQLLHLTISSKIYILVRKYQFDNIMQNGINVKFEVRNDGTCLIERKFADLFNSAQTQDLPPYFPGDRNRIHRVR